MTKTELKTQAKEKLLSFIQHSFYDDTISKEMIEEMSKQMERVEKLFGYEPKSWARG